MTCHLRARMRRIVKFAKGSSTGGVVARGVFHFRRESTMRRDFFATSLRGVLALAGMRVGCIAPSPRADFVVTHKAVGPPIAGFGACMNPYVFAFPNMPPEISAAQAGDLEAKVKGLQPQFVRVFFLTRWLDEDNDESVNQKHGGM